MKKLFIVITIIFFIITLTGCAGGNNGDGNKEPLIKEEIHFISGEWSYGREYNEKNEETGRLWYGWSMPFYSNVQCSLRVRHEYYSYNNPDIPETVLYTGIGKMDGVHAMGATGKYFTTNNIKKVRLILERMDQGTIQEIDFQEHDNIKKFL